MKSIFCMFVVCAAFTVFGLSSVNATVINIVDETFDDGGRTNGSDPLDIAWFKNTAGQSLSVVNDAVIGSGNALAVDVPSFTAPGATPSHVTFGSFATATVGPNVGDIFRFSFDFRFPTEAPHTGGSSGFRFGFFNVENPPAEDDFVTGFESGVNGNGYTSLLNVFSPTATVTTAREGLAADGVLGGAGFFSDGNVIVEVGGDTPTFNDTSVSHFLVYDVVRLSPTLLGFNLTIDDFFASGTDAFPPGFDSFNTIAFRGTNSNLDYTLDNVKIQLISTNVPEPTTFVLFGIGLIGFVAQVKLKNSKSTLG